MRRYLPLALAFVVVAILSVVLIPREDTVRIVTLPDGKRVEFLGTTIGPQTFTTEKPWHKSARRILPSALQKWIPQAVSGTCSSGTNSITIFVRVSDPNGAPIRGTPWQTYNAEDASGFLYHREGGYCAFGGGASSQIFGLSLNALPRREPTFRFHLLGAKESVMGSLEIPNPFRGPFEKWEPLPLPQAVTNGPVTLTLDSLWRDERYRWNSVSPRWTLNSTDSHWKRAKVRYLTFLDSSGNEGHQLSPQEPAWKLRATVHRDQDVDFSPGERWRLDNLPIPAKGQLINLDQVTNIMGVTIVAQVISSPGMFYLTNGVHHALDDSKPNDSGFSSSTTGNVREDAFGSSKPFLMIEVQGRQEGDDVRINVFDEQGRKLSEHPNGTLVQNRSSTVSLFVVRLDISPEAKSLNVETLVSRPLVFEFMVNPRDVQPAKPTSKK